MQKGQRKIHSFIETCINTAIGYFLSLATQIVVFPFFDIEVTLSEQFAIGFIFMAVSIVRGYLMRRLFNFIHVKGWL